MRIEAQDFAPWSFPRQGPAYLPEQTTLAFTTFGTDNLDNVLTIQKVPERLYLLIPSHQFPIMPEQLIGPENPLEVLLWGDERLCRKRHEFLQLLRGQKEEDLCML